MKKALTGKRWWSALLFALAVIVMWKIVNEVGILWGALRSLLKILSPFVGGTIIAVFLYRPSAAIERGFRRSRWKIFSRPARIWSLVIVYLALVGILAAVVVVLVPLVTEGINGLIAILPGYYKSFTEFLKNNEQSGTLLGTLSISKVMDQVYKTAEQVLTPENLMRSLSGLMNLTTSFVNVLISFIVSVYMLAGRESLLSTLRRLGDAFLPEKAVSLTAHYSRKATDIFSRYVYGMLIDAAIVFVTLIPGMYIAKIPYPLAFAAIIGVANLVPYFGALIAGVLAVLVLVLGGHWGAAVFLAIYILVIQQVDGNILQPKIYGQSGGIKPLYVLLALTVGGGIGGVAGILLGGPVMAVLQILVEDLVAHRNRAKRDKAAEAAADGEDDKDDKDDGE